MFRTLCRLVCLAFLVTGVSRGVPLSAADPDPARQWGQWRGPLATGVSPYGDPPIEWSEDKNVRWASRLPGTGHSTPVVWGQLVFVTAAVPFGEKVTAKPDADPGAHDNLPVTQPHRYLGLAYERRSGELLWQKTLERNFHTKEAITPEAWLPTRPSPTERGFLRSSDPGDFIA